MRRIEELYWRPDRAEHIYERHRITTEEVDEAAFDDPRGHLYRIGPAERNPEETIYRCLGCTASGRYLLYWSSWFTWDRVLRCA